MEFQPNKKPTSGTPEDAMTSWLISIALGLSMLLFFVSIDRVQSHRIFPDGGQAQPQPAVYSAQGLPAR
jgi:hypothetical protein